MRLLIFIPLVLFVLMIKGQSSVLSTGQWHKVGITETGVYKLDFSTLNSLGVDLSQNPQTIKIYGNGVQGVLPQENDLSRPFDLVENAISVAGETDGSFDEADYVIFYGLGPDKMQWSTEGFEYEKNIYSDTSYYFITSGGADGKRIQNLPSVSGAGVDVSTYHDALAEEADQNNLLSSGRGWYGEIFSIGETQSFNFSLENLSSNVQFILSAVGQSSSSNFFEVLADGNVVGTLPINSIPSGPGSTYSIKAQQSLDTILINQNEQLAIQLSYHANGPTGLGFLDYYVLLFERELRLSSEPVYFRTTSNIGSVLSYQLDNGEGTTIWNITDPANIGNQNYALENGVTVFQSQSDDLEEFAAFSESNLSSPHLVGSVGNQNLKVETQLDGIIITHPTFLSQAERLAQFHRDHDNLSVKTVTTTQVYNEFSSGRQDVTAIRDYAKYVYDSGGRLKYLTLFGDCSYDYKNRVSSNTNFVPTYESRDSFHPIFSHSSDDYFGFFESNEGLWEESVSGDHTLEVGIGRLPVKTLEEATNVVDKIIYYCTSPNTLGKWRNEIAYLADDGDSNIHAEHVDALSELIDTTYTQYSIDKLLLDAFEQEVGVSSQSSPSATQALKEKIKSGAFAINFIGHGNERLWTEEQVLTRTLIRRFNNRNRLPIFVTATCEFGRYDDPAQFSGAEELLLSETGGAIALLTTSRPVFASTNFGLNQAFHENIFRRENGSFQRLGDVIRATKNNGLAGPVNRNFTLLGDPMMMPAYPQLDITINELTTQLDTLSALEKITFTGQIEGPDIQSNFNGSVSISIFDIEQGFQTKGQESDPYNYTLQNNALFRGESSVTNGAFSFTFVVPKNISYQYKEGKISLYAWDEENNQDAAGSSTEFVLGGTSATVETDNEAPDVTVYLNDETFVNGSTVNSSSLLIAKVSDENGISITSNGFSQGVSLELDDQVINLNKFYVSDLDSYQDGTITYPIQDLAPGRYTATLNVYDTYNNLTKQEISFIVSEQAFISIFSAKAYPNPVVNEEVIFSFDHDREEEDLDIQLIVYSDKGEVVKRTSYEFENSSRSVNLLWGARTAGGQPFSSGIYFYRLIIQSRFDGVIKEISSKLVIAN